MPEIEDDSLRPYKGEPRSEKTQAEEEKTRDKNIIKDLIPQDLEKRNTRDRSSRAGRGSQWLIH
jgi:hypothetical protein